MEIIVIQIYALSCLFVVEALHFLAAEVQTASEISQRFLADVLADDCR